MGTVTDIKPQDLIKMFVKEVGALIEARAKTTEIVLKAEIKAEIKASEERQIKQLSQVKEELREEFRRDIKLSEKRIIETIGGKLIDHEERIKVIEDRELSASHKN